MHRDRPGRQDHVLPGPDPGVGPPAVDLDRAHGGRHLLDAAGQRGNCRLDDGCGQRRHVVRRGDLALGVVGEGGLPEPDRRGVGLVAADQERQELGGPVDPEHEHPGSHRVQGAGVAHATGAAQPAHLGHHVVAGPAGRLVHDEQPVGGDGPVASGHRSFDGSAVAPALGASPSADRVLEVVLVLDRLLVGVGLARVGGTAGGGGHGGVALLGLAQQRLHVGGGVGQRVGEELQRRGQPDADALADRGPQLALGRLERRRGLRALGLAAEDGVEHRGVLQVTGDAHVGDGDEPQALVLDTELERLGHDDLDAVRDLLGPCRISHGTTFLRWSGWCDSQRHTATRARGPAWPRRVELRACYERGISRISCVSMTSPTRRSL